MAAKDRKTEFFFSRLKSIRTKRIRNLEEYNDTLSNIAFIQQELDKVEAEKQKNIQKAEEQARKQSKHHVKNLEKEIARVAMYAKEHREELAPKSKTAKLNSGIIQWRIAKESVVIKSESKAVKYAERHGIFEILKQVHQISKEAIKKHKERAQSIPGLFILPEGEQLDIKPIGTNMRYTIISPQQEPPKNEMSEH